MSTKNRTGARVRRWAFLPLLLSASASALPTGAGAQDTGTALPSCNGKALTEIVIAPQDPSFLSVPGGLRPLAHGVGLHHPTSKEEMIGRFVLGRSTPWFGAHDDDLFLAADLYGGYGSPTSFAALRIAGEAGRDLGTARWDSMVGGGGWRGTSSPPQFTLSSAAWRRALRGEAAFPFNSCAVIARAESVATGRHGSWVPPGPSSGWRSDGHWMVRPSTRLSDWWASWTWDRSGPARRPSGHPAA